MIKEIVFLPRKPGAPGNPPRQLILECDQCHASFERLYTSERAKALKHFCSSTCTYSGRAPSPLHGRKTTRPCSQCGKDITRMTSYMEGKQHVYCDRTCLALWRSANTPPERAKVMMTRESLEKSKAANQARRSEPGYVHPMLGRQHSEDSRAKMRASGACKHVGALNGMHGRGHTEESRAKMSEAHSRNLVEGRGYVYGGNGHSCGWHTSPKGNAGQSMYYRSSWEVTMMRHMDADENVLSYEYERLRIPYYDTMNNKRHYVPDFLITYADGSQLLCELKPKELVDNEKTRLKAEAARAWCDSNSARYELLTGEDLRNHGVIA